MRHIVAPCLHSWYIKRHGIRISCEFGIFQYTYKKGEAPLLQRDCRVSPPSQFMYQSMFPKSFCNREAGTELPPPEEAEEVGN